MPAPDWPSLLDLEAQFDAALPLVLLPFTEAPFGFTLYPQQAAEQLTAPRLEYQFSLGAPHGPGRSVQQLAAPAVTRVVAWNFSLLFRFIYDRRKLPAAALAFRGPLRERLAPETQAFDDVSLPWLDILSLCEVRAIRGIVKGEEQDLSLDAWETTWEGIVALRTDAFPV